jgi:hypothetical protein
VTARRKVIHLAAMGGSVIKEGHKMSSKITLYSGKLGEFKVTAASTNVDMPDVVEVINAKPKITYVDGVATDEVNAISLTVVDSKAIEVAKQAGLPVESMPSIVAEIQEPSLVSKLKSDVDKLVGQKLSTAEAQIALRWISHGNSGGWGGLKLILTQAKSPTTVPTTAKPFTRPLTTNNK